MCPGCSTKFKLVRTWRYYLWVLAWVLAFLLGTVLLAAYSIFEGFDGYYWVYWAVMTAIYWPVDRALESKLATRAR